MALMQCSECGQKVSDKAISCPHCGNPINSKLLGKEHQRSKRKYKKLPNGFGSIKKLSGKRRNPYAAYPPTKEYNLNGSPIAVPAIGYYSDWHSAFDALREYNHNPYDIRSTGLTFSDVYQQWFHAKFDNDRVTYSEQSKKTYRWAYNQCTSLHNMRMSEVHKNEMQEILDKCTLGFSSVRSIKNLFGQMFTYAIENGIVEKDYSKFISITIENDNERGEPFTEYELKLLWKNRNNKNVQIILIMIYSGLRIGELKIVEIDLENKCFRGGLKTKAGKERVVPIHNAILDFVRVFKQEEFHPGTFRDKIFYKLIQEIGMAPFTNGKKHTPHDCRHTFSWLCDKYMVDDMCKHMIMGHSMGRDVEKAVYGHRTFEQLQSEINKISVINLY